MDDLPVNRDDGGVYYGREFDCAVESTVYGFD
jgi:hypothetical protein